jgi:heptose I phosphotransferase
VIELTDELWSCFDNGGRRETVAFDAVLALNGKVFRRHKNRRTIRVELGGRSYFIKIHDHIGWGEILKNVLRLRRPVITSEPEVQAIDRLQKLGVPTVSRSGHGWRGRNPARRQSFIITDALEGTRDLLELSNDANLPAMSTALKRLLLERIARIAATLHDNGLNHRDFYLNHFLVAERDLSDWRPGESVALHLIDLHRLQIRARIPERYVAKDLSGLLFSSLDAGITATDCVRFLKIYWGPQWKTRMRSSRRLRRIISRRAIALYRAEHGKEPRLPHGLASFA